MTAFQFEAVAATLSVTVVDDIGAIAERTVGFAVMQNDDGGWVCVPWGRHEATGYGSSVGAAIADAAHQLEHQEATR